MKRVVVIGGGISGLAAAHRLTELHAAELQVTLLEASPHLGGLLETHERDGFLMEAGADAFLTEKPWAANLCRRIGLADELMETRKDLRRSQIAVGDRLCALPEGFHLMAAADPRVLWKVPGLSWPGKLRAAMEPWIRPERTNSDESVAGFIRRRLGGEMLERVAGPMIGGIYTADLEQLSMRAALPRFWEMEKQHGSLARALRAHGATTAAAGPRYGLFLTLRGGMRRMIEALAARLPPGAAQTSAEATRLEKNGTNWRVHVKGNAPLEADFVIVALPAPPAARLLQEAAPDLADSLREILCASVVTVNLAYRETDLPRALEGFGFVQSPQEGRGMVGCSFSSVKFSGRAPEGQVLLRAFVGGAVHPEVVDLSDEEILQRVTMNLRRLLGVGVTPRQIFIRHFRQAMPQYTLGHLDRVEALESRLRRHRGLTLIGNSTRGVGIPDCVRLAEQTAEKVADAV